MTKEPTEGGKPLANEAQRERERPSSQRAGAVTTQLHEDILFVFLKQIVVHEQVHNKCHDSANLAWYDSAETGHEYSGISSINTASNMVWLDTTARNNNM